MANARHIAVLRKGAAHWNRWRAKHPETLPDLSKADLSGLNLSVTEPETLPNEIESTRWYRYPGINFSRADLSHALLARSELYGADFGEAQLRQADLCQAFLHQATFAGATLRRTKLSEARLIGARFEKTLMTRTEMWGCQLAATRFLDVDLSAVEGLSTCVHEAPSYIGIDTIYRSGGQIDHVFLKACGVPASFVDYIPSLVSPETAIQFYSCFISYSTIDQEFAGKLHRDLAKVGIRSWLASEDMKIGDRIRTRIDDAIRTYDKLLLVLSDASLNSQWVEQEVEGALAKERREKTLALFPVRLDDSVFEQISGWPAYLRNSRHIGDFTMWKERKSYDAAFSRLRRDLRVSQKDGLTLVVSVYR